MKRGRKRKIRRGRKPSVCLSAKLRLLEPDSDTIVSYKEIETKSIKRLQEFLEGLDSGKYNKVSTQILSAVNKLRSTMKAQMTMRAQIFRDISKDKKELRIYIKSTFPHLVKK